MEEVNTAALFFYENYGENNGAFFAHEAF